MRILMVGILSVVLASCQTSKSTQTSINTNLLSGAQELSYDSIVYTSLMLAKLKWCRGSKSNIESIDNSIRSLRATSFRIGMTQYEADQAELIGVMVSAEYGCTDQDIKLITQKMDNASSMFRGGGASLSGYRSQYKNILSVKYGPVVLKEKSIFCNYVDGIISYLKALSDADRNMFNSLIDKHECTLLPNKIDATVKESNNLYSIVRIYGNGASFDGVTIATAIVKN